MSLGKVLYRSIGNKLAKQTKMMGYPVPKGAKTFDYLSASGKNRNFRVLTFRDETGKPITKKIDIWKNGEKTEKIIEKGPNISSVTTIKNGDGFANVRTFTNVNGKTLMLKNTINKNKIDAHSIMHLEQGKKAKGVSYTTAWQGEKPELKYTNIDKPLEDTTNLEYCPLGVEYVDPFRDKQRIRHISKIQEKELGLEGITPKVKVAKGNSNSSIFYADTAPYNGQITIYPNCPNDAGSLLGILGHEYRHASDFFNIGRLNIKSGLPEKELQQLVEEVEKQFPGAKHFDKKMKEAGLIPDGSEADKTYRAILDDYSNAMKNPKYFTNLETHDSYNFEQLANQRGAETYNKFVSAWNRLINFVLNS